MKREPVKSEKMWRVVSLTLLAFLVTSNGFQLYQLIEQSVTISHMREGLRLVTNDLGTLQGLTPLLSSRWTRSDILVFLRGSSPGALITETDSTIGIGQMRFVFDRGGTLVSIDEL
jgi:hypothetical protein